MMAFFANRGRILLLFVATISYHEVNFANGFRAPLTPLRRQTSTTLSLFPSSSPSLPPLPPSFDGPSASNMGKSLLQFYSDLDNLYNRSMSIKCPFIRRRAADTIDGAAMIIQFLLIRHKSLPGISDVFLDGGESLTTPDNVMSLFPAPGCKSVGRHIKRLPDGTSEKLRNLHISEISERIRNDWTSGTSGPDKGYYITGKLSSDIYRDDCLFVGPDPDMPVRGLRKYLSAAAHLFDQRQSFAQLRSIQFFEEGGQKGNGFVEVKWRIGGAIMLPWHPSVEPWTGWTKYHLEDDGLISLHEEGWDISVWRAFVCTFFPKARKWNIWRKFSI